MEQPRQKLTVSKDKMAKAQATIRFLAKAKIKQLDRGWYAYIPGQTPPKTLFFLEEMFQNSRLEEQTRTLAAGQAHRMSPVGQGTAFG